MGWFRMYLTRSGLAGKRLCSMERRWVAFCSRADNDRFPAEIYSTDK